MSTILIRQELDRSLVPAGLAVGLAFIIAVSVAMLLAQVVLRPIHVITSGLTRLGRGELDKPLDLRDEEFRDLGDVFDQVSAQLQLAVGDGPKRAQLADLTRRVASLGRLTAGVAHEVKNPLNAMTIHLELLKQKLASPEPRSAARHAEVIGTEIRRLDDVVQGFLKFVRPEDVTLAPVKVRALVTSVCDAVAPEAEHTGVTCENACQDAVLAVEGDEPLLRQALLNLAQNAVQAMPKGASFASPAGSRATDGSRCASPTPATALPRRTSPASSTCTSRPRSGAVASACPWSSARFSCTTATSTLNRRSERVQHS